MSAASVLARGQAAAEALMVDACTITRQTGSTTDHLTGEVTPTVAAVYTGRCKVQTPAGGSTGLRTEPAEAAVVTLRVELHLPVSTSTAVRHGDIVTITSSVHDPALAGRVYRVHDEMRKSMPTARRLQLEEAT